MVTRYIMHCIQIRKKKLWVLIKRKACLITLVKDAFEKNPCARGVRRDEPQF